MLVHKSSDAIVISYLWNIMFEKSYLLSLLRKEIAVSCAIYHLTFLQIDMSRTVGNSQYILGNTITMLNNIL